MNLNLSFKERSETGKKILSEQLPFTLNEFKKQILRIKNHGNQTQKKKKKGQNALMDKPG